MMVLLQLVLGARAKTNFAYSDDAPPPAPSNAIAVQQPLLPMKSEMEHDGPIRIEAEYIKSDVPANAAEMTGSDLNEEHTRALKVNFSSLVFIPGIMID